MKIIIIAFIIIAPFFAGAQNLNVDPAKMQQELILLKKALTTLHPGTYRYETPMQVDSIFLAAERRTQQPMPEGRYFILLSQLLTNVHCGHTYTNYWNQPKTLTDNLYSKACLPVLYRMIGRQMIVTHNLSDSKLIKAGDEIIAIGGVSVKRIVDSLVTVSQSDGRHGLARKLDNISIEPLDADTSNYNLADIYLPLFFPENFNTKNYNLTLQHFGSSKVFHVNLMALTKKERLAIYNLLFGTLPVHEKNWSLKFLDSNTACFSIGDFETWEWKTDYKKYLDSIFTLLGQKQIKNLIVDIRGNGGGDDEARDEVFSYLTDHPFGCIDPMHRRFRFLTIPDTLLPYLKTWNKSFKQPKNPSDYEQTPDGLFENKAELNASCVSIEPKANRFTGRKFLITDGRNSSTTFTLAKLFKTEHAGEIYGETTGGNQQGINGGQFFFFYLPYSNIEIDIPLVWGVYLGNHPDTGIQPDYPISTTRQNIQERTDPQIKHIMSAIAAQQ